MCDSHFFSPNKSNKGKDKSVHDQEHEVWSRRSFIQALGIAGSGSMMLGNQMLSASKASPLSIALSQSDNENILVIIRLEGGNDGLNTIVPVYDYASYANLRPTIRHQENELLNLNTDFAIPNYMNALESVWGDGQMKVVHGVGYPEQNLSHFRSTDIWASTADTYEEPTGWWGRYFEELYPDYLINPPEVPPAVQVGNVGNLIFEGNNNNYAFTVANIDQLQNVAENGTLHDVVNLPDCVYGDKLLYMRATANTTLTYSQVLHDAYIAGTNNANYGNGPLAAQLASVAKLIKGGLGTKVYMVSLGSFDTHANQVDQHQNLLQDLSSSIKAFYEDLATTGMDDKVLSMTISEFGRRPYENGSNGTDHGAASPMMLFGTGLNGSGFVGNHPDINVWDNNDNLIPTSDFRQVYATILTNWFCLEASVIDNILLNEAYEPLDLGFNCEGLSTSNFGDITRFSHAPVYQNDGVYIVMNFPHMGHGVIKLYDLVGREIGTLANQMFSQGKQQVKVQESIASKLSLGQYIYRISFGGQHYSKSFILK
ncbi:MAG: twin-arginine translocation pathway signal [Alteromonas sp.]|nr:twin-arginine translocation pathway signal [Alteromonas sp.]MAY21830.1 twin-arginine translocation pathway signal [Flavobacteriaceae bacterium]|tara:strand:- start:6979 stop:8601 length:1623 start_codon:yes stop_codon:yes gene_type:complete